MPTVSNNATIVRNVSSEATSDYFKLDPVELNKQPEDVFDIVGKLGEGSYGAVHKAVHKKSGQILAVKKVPVDTDLQEIIKEISIMQQCDSQYVVKYYGSYFKNADLWIVMEYCGAGSVSDIMRLRRKTLNEDEISAVLRDTLYGLEYLHDRRKIHRDVKAGNILLNTQGHAKLADFGVAGQLTDTMTKRNTVIGTPFWMSPEVIQEIGYDTKADIWSLGITAMEMAEGRPPHSDIHPMRAIFMIPTRPPPTFKNPDEWSPSFVDLIAQCLVKEPDKRKTATELLQHDFIRNARGSAILVDMINDAQEIAASHAIRDNNGYYDSDSVDSTTMVQSHNAPGIHHNRQSGDDDEAVAIDDGTLINRQIYVHEQFHTANSGEIAHQFNSLHLSPNGGGQYDAADVNHQGSMRTYETDENIEQPYFLRQMESHQPLLTTSGIINPMHYYQSSEHSAVGAVGDDSTSLDSASNMVNQHFQQAMLDGDYDFLRDLSLDDLLKRKTGLEAEMDSELNELRRRYQTKRQPILDAIETKKQRMVNF